MSSKRVSRTRSRRHRENATALTEIKHSTLNKEALLSVSESVEQTDNLNATTPKEKPYDDDRGRPSKDLRHRQENFSYLSHHNRNMNLRGLFNLLLILLVVLNARLVLENFMKYGIRIKPPQLPSSLQDLVENWRILLSLILMHGIFFASFFLEKYLACISYRRSFPRHLVLTMICGNASLILLVPYYCVRQSKAEPLSTTFLLGLSIVWFMKLASFHHTLHDSRLGIKHSKNATETNSESLHPDIKHFYTYLFMPTMCFQFQYPRNLRIRWHRILRHAIELLFCVILIKIIIDQYMMLILENAVLPPSKIKTMSYGAIFFHFSERILKLSIPNLLVWLLTFLSLFHHWLNILAELTRFADREFYLDWWNSGSFDEYWRKWNIPIHNFLHRHVYKPILRTNAPPLLAVNVVFLISALAHEYLVCVPLHLGFTGLVFTAFVLQIPLIALTSANCSKRHRTIGNLLFWVLFCFSGQPLAIIVYYYLWELKNNHQMS